MARNATCEGASILRCVFALMMSCALGCGPEPAEPEADEPINEQSEYDEISVPLTCEGIESDQDCVEPADNALRLDAEDRLGFEAITFDRDNMAILMRLKPGASLPERIKVGAPIYRARKDRKPFMAIVEQVDRRGDEVRVKVVAEITAAILWHPRRHRASFSRVREHHRQRLDLLVGLEREGSDTACRMTLHAVVAKDRAHVLVVGEPGGV